MDAGESSQSGELSRVKGLQGIKEGLFVIHSCVRRSFTFVGAVLMTVTAMSACMSSPGESQPRPNSTGSSVSTHGTTSAPADRPEDRAAGEALATYEQFWKVHNAADAAPGAKDWAGEISKFAADPARQGVIDGIANLASYPAHAEGTATRSPKVESVSLQTPQRVKISDCLDVTGVRIVGDKDGKDLLDRKNQPQRYVFTAEVVRYEAPTRWLVQTTTPSLDRQC